MTGARAKTNIVKLHRPLMCHSSFRPIQSLRFAIVGVRVLFSQNLRGSKPTVA
jgi:hypothetical protein